MKKKIKTRILTYLISLSLLGIVLVTLTGVYFTRQATLHKHFESTKFIASEILHNVNEVYKVAANNVTVIAENNLIKESLSSPQILKEELNKLKLILGTYDDITVLTPEGEVLTSTDYNFTRAWKYHDYFLNTVETKKAQTSNAYFLPEPLRYITTFTAPVFDKTGKLTAVIAAQLNMDKIHSIVQHVSLNKTGHAYLLDKNNLYISHNNRDKTLTTADSGLSNMISSNAVKLIIKMNNEKCVGNYAQEKDRTVVILQSQEEVLDYFNSLFWNILIISLCIAVLALVIGLKLSQSLTKPIEDLNAAIQSFKSGDNQAKAKVSTEDEIGKLAEEFNLMLTEVLDFRVHLEELVKTRTRELENAKDEAESANRAKSSFLANMSHEIRTPMNAILGFAQILHQMENDEEKKTFLVSIITGAKTLLSIINDILDLSKIEAGKFSLLLSQASIKTILKETCSILSNEARKKDLELTYEVEKNFPQMIIVDELRLRQVLINLVGNAIKFTDNGTVKLSAKFSLTDELKKFTSVTIEVADTGIGISKEEQEIIFNDFVQSEKQGDKLYQGTGLGLAICRKLITLMNGRLEVKSSLNKGATFMVELPKVEISEIMVEDEDYLSSLANNYLNFEGSKVLLVDDNMENLKFIQKLLEGHNLKISTAFNGEQAIKVAQEITPDLILMDLKMPKLNGYQAAETIKSNLPTKDIPILAISASIVDEKADSFKTLFEAFIPKPVSSDKLFKSLMEHLPHSYSKKGIEV